MHFIRLQKGIHLKCKRMAPRKETLVVVIYSGPRAVRHLATPESQLIVPWIIPLVFRSGAIDPWGDCAGEPSSAEDTRARPKTDERWRNRTILGGSWGSQFGTGPRPALIEEHFAVISAAISSLRIAYISKHNLNINIIANHCT